MNKNKHVIQIKITPSGWDGTINAKEVARASEERARAERNTSRYRVDVLPERWRGPLVRAKSAIRAHVYHGTMPWQDGGWRLIPSDRIDAFMAGLEPLMVTYREAGQNIIDDREEIDRCNAARLGDWTSSMMLPHDMGWDTEVQKQLVADPRMDAYCRANNEAMQEQTKQHDDLLASAVSTLFERVREIIGSIMEKHVAVASGKDVKWGSLRQQILKTSEAIRGLNATGDTTLDAIADEISTWKMDIAPDITNVAKLLGMNSSIPKSSPKQVSAPVRPDKASVAVKVPAEAPKAVQSQPEAVAPVKI